jgi:hypothetical protein
MQKIDPNTILALDLVSKSDYIAELEADIENWKQLQVENCHSASAIRHYAELVYEARRELNRVRGIEQDNSIACICCAKGVEA